MDLAYHMKDWSFNQMGIKYILKSTLKFLVIFMVLLQAVFFTACSDNKHLEIERDGNLSYTYLNEVDEENKALIVENNHILYDSLSYYYTSMEQTEAYKVDFSLYDFYVVIPIKSKKSFPQELKIIKEVNYLDLYNKSSTHHGSGLSGTLAYKNVQIESDNYYHYNVYFSAQLLAHLFHLNDIVDKVIYMDYFDTDGIKRTDYSTNKLTIPAEEFEEMLDGLGISHERLEFQPDGY